MAKRLTTTLSLALLIAVGYYVWFVHINYRFEPISEGRVFKSAAIPPDRLAGFLQDHGIRTVIDLRDPGVQDALNPAKQEEIDAEAAAVAKVEGVRHVNIPSRQVPTGETLSAFFKVLDDEASYPVLIHCHHGTGRAEIYSALYRIEYENWDNGAARAETRLIVEAPGFRSSFADGKPKGDFLMQYRPRRLGANSTLSRLRAGGP